MFLFEVFLVKVFSKYFWENHLLIRVCLKVILEIIFNISNIWMIKIFKLLKLFSKICQTLNFISFFFVKKRFLD